MSPAPWNLLAHPATGWRAWWIEHAGPRAGGLGAWWALALGLALALAWAWQALVGGGWGPPAPTEGHAPVDRPAPAWWRAWHEAQHTQPRLLALEAALPPWDAHAPERSRLWQGDGQQLQWQGRTAAPSPLAARLQQVGGTPWRWHSLTREGDDSGALTLHSPRPNAAPAAATPTASALAPALAALPRSDQTEQLWPWVQAGLQAHGLQVQQLRPATTGVPQGSAAEVQLHLVLQGQWPQWLAWRQALWRQAPGWRDVRWRVVPAPQAPERLHFDWLLRWPLRPVATDQALWQAPAWAAAAVASELAAPAPPRPEAVVWRDLGRWHEGPRVQALLQGPQGAGLWAEGQALPHTPWRVQRITAHTVWLQGPQGPPWPLPRGQTP